MRKPVFLILEDKNDHREDIAHLVEEEGGDTLVTGSVIEATDIAASRRFHCLIVDLQMPGDPDDGPFGGELLLDRFLKEPFQPPTLITSFYTSEELNERIHRRYTNIVGIVKRRGNPNWLQDLRPLVHTVTERTGINWSQEVILESGLTWNDLTNISVNGVRPGEDDIRDLLGCLFADVQRIRLHPLGGGRSEAMTVKVLPEITKRSGKGFGSGVVAKFGSHDEIRGEYKNYSEFVEKILAGPGRATYVRRQPLFTWLLGGIIYSLIQSRGYQHIQTFEEYYPHADVSSVGAAMTDLFGITCGPWYEEKGLEILNLAGYYLPTKRLQRAKSAFQRVFADFVSQLFVQLPGMKQAIPNPYIGLDAFIAHASSEQTHVCPIHGDLHSRNVLVDKRDGISWIIDFALTGVGHYFGDLIRFELSVLFEFPQNDRTEDYVDFFEVILGQTYFTEDMVLPASLVDRESFVKALAAVKALRDVAGQLQYPVQETDEYLRALYCRAWSALPYLGGSGSFPIEKRIPYLALLCILSRRFGSAGSRR